jgi:membrane fusion protein (multidrug efflux system)
MAVLQWFQKARSRAVAAALAGACLAVSLAACNSSEGADKAKQAAAPPPPPPPVVVVEVVQKTVPIYREYVGQTDARDTVEIRARVQAFLEAQHFTEGTVVEKDQLLFTLDKREYETKLRQTKAELDVALARLSKAATDERRLRPLAERKAVPQQDYDDAAANLLAAKAAVEAARSQVAEAELNLSYTAIYSPITGLIGQRLVAPGNLVGRGEATLLDTVSSIDPIRVNFTISEADYLRFMAQRKERGNVAVPLDLELADGSVFPHKGEIVIFDRAADTKTGTFTVVAEFPNPERELRPGQFGRVRGVAETARDAIVIPKRAVQEIQGTKTVLVVGADDMVALRTIQPGETVGDLLIVRDGLKPGERVIVDGVQKARPGSKVNPSLDAAGSPPGPKTDEKAPPEPATEASTAPAAGK